MSDELKDLINFDDSDIFTIEDLPEKTDIDEEVVKLHHLLRHGQMKIYTFSMCRVLANITTDFSDFEEALTSLQKLGFYFEFEGLHEAECIQEDVD